METIPDAVPTVFTEPPVEDQLAWNTLWPESHKLYGHGNELFSICCDYEGKLVASSCKVLVLLLVPIHLKLVDKTTKTKPCSPKQVGWAEMKPNMSHQ